MSGKWNLSRYSEPRQEGPADGWIIEDVEVDQTAPVHLQKNGLRAGRLHGAGPVRDDEGEWKRGRRPGSTRALSGVAAARVVETDREIALGDRSTDEYSWVGRRGRFRPEVVVVLFGALFVVLGLLKPWPGSTKPQTGPVSPVAAIAAASGSANAPIFAASPGIGTPTAVPTVNIYALIPPYNYRPGQWPPPSPKATAAPAVTAWSSMNWSFLAVPDLHTRWGISALTLPSQAPTKGQSVPFVNWAAEIAPWSPSTVIVPRGSAAFALALTWPAGLDVSQVTFDYLGLLGSRPTVDQPVVAPAAGVTPLPAAAVATPAPSVATPSTAAADAPLLKSGTFWIAPSGDLASPTPDSLRAAWRTAPWSWPVGTYRATLATNAGTMIVVMQLKAV